MIEKQMTEIWNWAWANKEWVFSGAGFVIIGGIFAFFKWGRDILTRRHSTPAVVRIADLTESKEKTMSDFEILFIDDETSFKVVDILRDAGWKATKIVRDVSTLDSGPIAVADLIFVDIQGVGKELGFREGGLGLTAAIKKRHPEKFVVIYSAENRGNRFHEALQVADSSLSKTSDPYQFQLKVEQYFEESKKS